MTKLCKAVTFFRSLDDSSRLKRAHGKQISLLLSLPGNIHLQNFYRLDAFQINKRSNFLHPQGQLKCCGGVTWSVHKFTFSWSLNFFCLFSFDLVVPSLFVNAIEISCAAELDGQSCECDEFRISIAVGDLVSLESSSVWNLHVLSPHK